MANPGPQAPKDQNRLIGRFINFFVWVFVAMGFGFVYFLSQVTTSPEIAADVPVDGIVVLAGDRGRIASGLSALEGAEGKRLLVSGVNAALAPDIIRRAIGGRPDLARCCIDLGREAIDTRSNAREAAAWARDNGFASLLLITNDYHMPRSMIEMEQQGRDLRLAFRAVPAEVDLGVLVLEYLKYLVSLSRSIRG